MWPGAAYLTSSFHIILPAALYTPGTQSFLCSSRVPSILLNDDPHTGLPPHPSHLVNCHSSFRSQLSCHRAGDTFPQPRRGPALPTVRLQSTLCSSFITPAITVPWSVSVWLLNVCFHSCLPTPHCKVYETGRVCICSVHCFTKGALPTLFYLV